MSVREQQKEKRRMQILLAGLDLFVRRGYAATKTSDIAKAVNMSAGLMFHYFESKEKLYEELVTLGLKGTQISMQQNVCDPIAFFEQSVSRIFMSIKQQPWTAKMFILMAQAQQNEGTPETVHRIAMQVNNIEKSIKVIENGQKQGLIRTGDPCALSNAFWCSVQGIAEQLALHPEIPLPETEWIIDIIKRKGESQ